MPKQQTQRSMFDEWRDKEIERRLAAFDEEAEVSDDPEEVITECRSYLEHELRNAPTLLPSRAELQGRERESDYKRIKNLYDRRKYESEACDAHRLEHPHSGHSTKILTRDGCLTRLIAGGYTKISEDTDIALEA